MWLQKKIQLTPKSRGFHLITHELVDQLPEIRRFRRGLGHFFLCHTSASLTLNENADPDVRRDLAVQLDRMVPDGAAHFIHVLEGADDMPAHVKCSLLGVSVTLPLVEGRLGLGVWQGLYLGEHRDLGGARILWATLHGEGFDDPSSQA